MIGSINLDIAAKNVKNILDKTRCPLSANITCSHWRYPCGIHTACERCISHGNDCVICRLTPLDAIRENIIDRPMTERANNAVALLKSFQDSFQIEVSSRLRTSEQLKLEKSLFPNCIQAERKYFNKRKSSNNSFKENFQISFPGELVNKTESLRMDKSKNYVQEWLDQHEHEMRNDGNKYLRKPLSDLSVNSPKAQCPQAKPRNSQLLSNKNKSITKAANKKTSFKSALTLDKCQTRLTSNSIWKSAKNINQGNHSRATVCSSKLESEGNVSVIILDDSPIAIADSQNEGVDKDQVAYQAVLEAERKIQSQSGKYKDSEELQCYAQNNKKSNHSRTTACNTMTELKDNVHVINLDDSPMAVAECHSDGVDKDQIAFQSTLEEDLRGDAQSNTKFLFKHDSKDKCQDNAKDKNLHTTIKHLRKDQAINTTAIPMYNNRSITEIYKNSTVNKTLQNLKKDKAIDFSLKIETKTILCTVNISSCNPIKTVVSNISQTYITETKVKFPKQSNSDTYTKHTAEKSTEELDSVIKNVQTNDHLDSQDLFKGANNGKHNQEKYCLERNVIISESESDSEIESSFTMQTTADVHRSSDVRTHGVLSPLRERGQRAMKRRKTPASSDSSEKENRDPNRTKKCPAKKSKGKKNKFNI